MVHSFLQYIQHEKRYSLHTVQAYSADLANLESYLKQDFDCLIETASFQMLRSWILFLSEQGNSSKTISRKIASARSFFKFLLKKGYIQTDPSKNIIAPKVEKRLPEFIQESQLLSLLDGLAFTDDFEGQRDKIILELLYCTGIRLSELINLEEGHIDFESQAIKVLGKGNKERIIPIHDTLLDSLRIYLQLKSCTCPKQNSKVIVTNKGDDSYPMFVYRIVKRYLLQIFASKRKSPHVLRHTFATHLLNKGADLNAIKELMGHSSLAATQVYTHNSLDKLKETFDQAHPKA